jgi:hypothetical protein
MFPDGTPEELGVRVDLCGWNKLGLCQVGDDNVQINQIIDMNLGGIREFRTPDKPVGLRYSTRWFLHQRKLFACEPVFP